MTNDGKAVALAAFEKRKAKNAGKERIDNGSLQAGSPMYYYCQPCGQVIVLPEAHTCVVPECCDECQHMKDKGWLK